MKDPDLIVVAPSATAQVLCTNTLKELHKHYPGYEWIVGVDDVGGVVKIFLAEVSGQYGYILHINDLKIHDELVRKVRNAGGELLERYNLNRARMRLDQVHDIKRSFTGEAIQA